MPPRVGKRKTIADAKLKLIQPNQNDRHHNYWLFCADAIVRIARSNIHWGIFIAMVRHLNATIVIGRDARGPDMRPAIRRGCLRGN